MEQRLSKWLATQGVCSRREADFYITQGWVRVNGQTAQLGQKVSGNEQIVLAEAAKQKMRSLVTVILHKPLGYVSGQAEHGHLPASCLIKDEHHWHLDRPYQALKQSIAGLAPAGRLDIDSTGLLIMTQNGQIARQIIGEDSHIEKEYWVKVKGQLSANGLALLNHGLSLDHQLLKPAKVRWLDPQRLQFILHEGKKRQIRRMCELVGLEVVALKRVRIGRISLDALPYGKWRYMRSHETLI